MKYEKIDTHDLDSIYGPDAVAVALAAFKKAVEIDEDLGGVWHASLEDYCKAVSPCFVSNRDQETTNQPPTK